MQASRLKSHAKVAFRALLGPRLYEQVEFRRHVGYWPNLVEPQTFNEKISARKFRPFPKAPLLVDKLAVRDFVQRRVGGECLTRLYYGGASPTAVNYGSLPRQYVLKGVHGSGPDFRVIVRDKTFLSARKFIALASRILRRRCGREVNEWWYGQVEPRLLIEELLLDADGKIPPDLKVYVFGGVARYVQVIKDRHDVPRSAFYDRDWRRQPFTREIFPSAQDIAQPSNLKDLLEIAETLAVGFDFLRVDLYSVGNRIVFGELTLAPGAGWIPFRPARYDSILGELWLK